MLSLQVLSNDIHLYVSASNHVLIMADPLIPQRVCISMLQ